jgi:hypothetical protein
MTFDQVERAIQFMLEKQATFEENDGKLQQKLDRLEADLETMMSAIGQLLAVARIHSERLDRIEGIGPA